MEKEPFNCPGNDPFDDRLAWPPSILDGIVETKRWKIRMVSISINMLPWFTRSARVASNRGIDNEYTDVRVVQVPTIELPAREINDPNAIGLADGPQRALPHTYPLRVRGQLELRAIRPQFLILLVDRQRTHRTQSPQGLLLGVARAVAGTAAEPSAGMLPLRGM
jgi:hypothetical protein